MRMMMLRRRVASALILLNALSSLALAEPTNDPAPIPPTPVPTVAPTPAPATPVATTSPTVSTVAPPSSGIPELPRAQVDTSLPTVTGIVRSVAAGGDLQAALNASQPGDAIELGAGATFTGNYTVPAKSGNGSIWVRTSAWASSLPARGTRIQPSSSALLPKIVSPNTSPALHFAFSANNYYFTGIEVTTTHNTSSAVLYDLILMGYGPDQETQAVAVAQLPTHVVFDRCYIHGTPSGNVRRGITMNAANRRSSTPTVRLSRGRRRFAGLASWNGPGPFKIVNNYLAGAGENLHVRRRRSVRFPISFLPTSRSAATTSASLCRGRSDDPSYAGIHWTVKNLLELKNAQRVLVDGNVLENNWGDAQNGFAILFTPRNQGGTAPWSGVQDITFSNNIVRHVGSGMNISGTDSDNPSQRTTRVLVRNNLFDDVNGKTWGADGHLFQVLGGVNSLAFRHNTGIQTGVIMMADGSPANQGFEFADNIAPHGTYGFFGSNDGEGSGAIAHYFPGAVFTSNVIVSGYSYSGYSGNFFPSSMNAVGFTDPPNGDYSLAPGSSYKGKGTDGKDIGVDWNALINATAGAR